MPQRLDAAVTSVSGRPRSPRCSGLQHRRRRGARHAHHGCGPSRGVRNPTRRGGWYASIGFSPVKPGPYWLTLEVTGSGDRFTSTRLAVVLGPTLAESAARHAVEYRLNDEITYDQFRVGDCHRINRRRIDCEAQGPRRCTGIHAVTLRKAFTFVRRYGCRAGVRRTPRWLEPAQPWPVLGKPPG